MKHTYKNSICIGLGFLALTSGKVIADELHSITLIPSPSLQTELNFQLEIEEVPQNSLGLRFNIRFVRIEGISVSALKLQYGCSLGVVVCELAYLGDNSFSPTMIFISDRIAQTADICDIDFVFTYPAYSYLMRFDWSLPDPGIEYYDDQRLPPDFTGIEEWVLMKSDCVENQQ